jgi:hypothetical protein
LNVAYGSFIKTFVQNAELTLMIDNGADISIIKETKLKKTTPIKNGSQCSITGVTPGAIKTIGLTTLRLNFYDSEIDHDFQVVDITFPLQVDGILGRDFLSKYRCNINYDTYLLSVNLSETILEVPFADETSADTIVVPARCEVIKRLLMINIQKPHLLLAQEIQKGVFCCNAIIDQNKLVKFVNVNQHDVEIKNFVPQLVPMSEYNLVESDVKININTVIQEREKKLFEELNLDKIPPYAINSIKNICKEHSSIFALKDDKLSTNNFYEQKIRLEDGTPVFTKNYRIPHNQKKIINSQVQEMLQNDIVEDSVSPFNSPLLLVPKKGSADQAEWRLVIDFRKLNKKVIGDKFPLPRIEEILDQLGRAKYFSILDLKAGYHQIPISKESRECTAFSSDLGHFQFKRLPFGLKVSGNSFQRMMAIAMAGLTPESAFLYVDDLVVFGCSQQHHNSNLIKVFERLENYNLKLNPKKCQFMQSSVTYLGHFISSEGIRPDPSKFSAVKNYPKPENADDTRRFIAFCNYYRRFVPDFAELAHPLNLLLKKNTVFKWTEKCQAAFETLKNSLITPPILQFPNFEQEFHLTTDASNVACGAVLSQVKEGKDLPIAFASKSFSKGEKNKSTILKELTAIHWAVNHFKPYLYGKKFTIYTDHKPLIFLYSMKNPSSKLTRMRWDLEEFNYIVKYIPGSSNCGADALSRIELDSEKLKELKIMYMKTRSKSLAENKKQEQNLTNENSAETNLKVFEDLYTKRIKGYPELKFEKNESNKLKKGSGKEIIINIKEFTRFNRLSDSALEQMIKQLEIKVSNLNVVRLALTSKIFEYVSIEKFKDMANKNLEKLSIVLYYEPQEIVEKEKINEILDSYHNSPLGGHVGVTRMLKSLQKKYRWVNMKKSIQEFVKNCKKCKLNKHTKIIKEKMTITTTPNKTFEVIQMDTIGPFTKTTAGNRYALTIQDELSKYIKILPIPNKEAKTLAKVFVEGFILTFGTVKHIKTDQGTEYMNQIFQEICELLRIDRINAVAYHPETMGSVEKNHKCLNEYIRAFVNENRDDWDHWTKYYEFCYNTTPSVAHDYAPFELIFGKLPFLPTDLVDSKIDPIYNIENYAKEMKFRLQEASKRAKKFIIEAKEKSKIYFDKTTNESNFEINDEVILESENRRKLDPIYKGPFIVIQVDKPNSVIKCKTSGKIQTVHNNRLKLFK